ncbi:MAG: hypothetical protein LBT33_07270 [Spirochaetia bacterium]|jgi:hypothetical protein|nr:hypothetical protein [Spirochaetia bacterium]
MMKAIEFEVSLENGCIRIPKQYRDTITNGNKVLVFAEGAISRKSDIFPDARIDMSGFKFNREEANER